MVIQLVVFFILASDCTGTSTCFITVLLLFVFYCELSMRRQKTLRGWISLDASELRMRLRSC